MIIIVAMIKFSAKRGYFLWLFVPTGLATLPQWQTTWKSREAPEKAYSMLIESGFAETVVLSVV